MDELELPEEEESAHIVVCLKMAAALSLMAAFPC